MKSIDSLVSEFIEGSDNFYDDLDLKDLDNKHASVVKDAYAQFDSKVTADSFRNWKGQSDMSAPFQISIDMLRSYGILNTAIHYLYRKLFRRSEEANILSAILDDVDIIKEVGGYKYLKENPVHQTPGVGNFYQSDDCSYNMRWLRYIYAISRIKHNNLLPDDGIWVDVGSYYGGLQGVVKKYYPNARIILVDFHHQLCRSFIYLSTLYPDANHILPNQIKEYSDLSLMSKGSIAYVPISSYSIIKDNQVDLSTNFFSFGEMRRDVFSEYFNSRIFAESKKSYLVNRFVSAPFFEPTYDSDLCVNDYQSDKRQLDYFDVFPMHHYMLPYRKLFGRKYYRNTSSSYFEMITSNI